MCKLRQYLNARGMKHLVIWIMFIIIIYNTYIIQVNVVIIFFCLSLIKHEY
jgi:hypothetical protein